MATVELEDFRWSESAIESLIIYFQDEESLWKLANEKYYNLDERKAAFMRISTKMNGVNIDIIEKKIRSLRIEMAARLRDTKKPSGSSGGKQKRPWKHFKSLLFLKDQIMPRNTISNITNSSERATESNCYDENQGLDSRVVEKDAETVETIDDTLENELEDLATERQDDVTTVASTSTLPHSERKLSRKRKQINTDGSGSSEKVLKQANVLMEEITKRINNKNDSRKLTDEESSTRMFCDMLYHELMGIKELHLRQKLKFLLHNCLLQFQNSASTDVYSTPHDLQQNENRATFWNSSISHPHEVGHKNPATEWNPNYASVGNTLYETNSVQYDNIFVNYHEL